jgi:hypothetical protein
MQSPKRVASRPIIAQDSPFLLSCQSIHPLAASIETVLRSKISVFRSPGLETQSLRIVSLDTILLKTMDDNDDNTTGNPSTFLNLNRSAAGGDGGVSDLEQDVLDEYARLAGNMKTVC